MEDLIKLLDEELEADLKDEEDPKRRKKIGNLLREATKGTEMEKEIEEIMKRRDE